MSRCERSSLSLLSWLTVHEPYSGATVLQAARISSLDLPAALSRGVTGDLLLVACCYFLFSQGLGMLRCLLLFVVLTSLLSCFFVVM